MHSSINNINISSKTLLNIISSNKILPANQVDKKTLLIRPVSGGINSLNKDNLESKSLLNNSFTALNQSPNKTKAYIKSLKDKIFSPGDFSSSKSNSSKVNANEANGINTNNKNQAALAELSKSLLSSPLLTKTPELSTKTKSITSSLSQYLPDKTYYNHNKKTLILDLDETLVHSNFKSFYGKSDIVLNIPFDHKNHTIHVLKRPFVDEFLYRMEKIYELVIFTASIPEYANPLLNQLDPNKRISYKLFREHCTASNNLFIKDLRKVRRNLKDTILLDNNPVSYALNKENGLPILTWHSNKSDTELVKLVPLLEYLAKVNDVRDVITKVVRNGFVNQSEVDKLLINSINSNKEEEKNSNSSQILNNTVNYSISNGISGSLGFKPLNKFYFDEKEKKAQEKEVELFHDFFNSNGNGNSDGNGSGNLLLDKKYKEKYDMFYEVKDKGRKGNNQLNIKENMTNDIVMPSNNASCNFRERERDKESNKDKGKLASYNTTIRNNQQDETYSYSKPVNSNCNKNSDFQTFYKINNSEAPSIPLNKSKLNQLFNYFSPVKEQDNDKDKENGNSHSKIWGSYKSKYDYSNEKEAKVINQFPKRATISLQEQSSNMTNALNNTNKNNLSPYSQLMNWDLNTYPLKSSLIKEENSKFSFLNKNQFLQEKNRNASQTLRDRSNNNNNNDFIGKYR